MSKKIIIHLNSLGKGGAERVAVNVAEYLSANGYEAVLVTLWKADEEYELPDSVKRINIGDITDGRNRYIRAAMRICLLRKIVKEEKASLVLSFCNKANFRACIALSGTKVPLIVSVRNDPQVDYAPYMRSVHMMERRADGCVFQTEDARAFFADKLADKSCIIMNPLNTRYLTVDWQQNMKGPLVAVGRISSQKNHMLLIQAFNEIKDCIDNELHIVGGTEEEAFKQQIEQYIAENSLGSRVFLKGISGEVDKVLSNASVYVLPSEYEGMPNSLMEAMSVGMPVVSTDCPCGGPKMLIENGVNGELVPVGDVSAMADAILKIYQNEDYAVSIAAAAKEIRNKQNPDAVLAKWKEYLDKYI